MLTNNWDLKTLLFVRYLQVCGELAMDTTTFTRLASSATHYARMRSLQLILYT
jgi:hypothetical protein